MRRKPPIPPTGQSATVWWAWRCFPWVTWKARAGTSSTCCVARRSDIIRYQYDQRSLAGSFYSLILWLQGFAEQAMRSIECNLVDARASDHPVSLAAALLWSAYPVALFVGDLT